LNENPDTVDGVLSVFGVRNENDDGDVWSFLGVAVAGVPNEKPEVGVVAAFRLAKKELATGSGFGLTTGLGVAPDWMLNGELGTIY
jgi:hypothetical protein